MESGSYLPFGPVIQRILIVEMQELLALNGIFTTLAAAVATSVLLIFQNRQHLTSTPHSVRIGYRTSTMCRPSSSLRLWPSTSCSKKTRA